MIKKIFKWTGITVLTLVVLVALVTTLMFHRTYNAPYPNIKASKDSAVIARGKHLVQGPAHCADCHSTAKSKGSLTAAAGDAPLSGGFKFEFPLGRFYTPNLTPDPETGLGRFTDGEIARTLRYGVKRNGESAIPFMPFQNLSDEDLTAIVSYLRTLQPVRNAVPEHSYSLMGTIVKAFLLKPEGPQAKPPASVQKDTSAAYGQYIVSSVANCSGCHTRRDDMGKPVGAPLAGGVVFEEAGFPTLVTPNLTQHPSGRLWHWTEADFIKRFRMGRVIKHSHMPWESYKNMSDDELKAIFNYLKSIKPAPTEKVAVKGKA
ncbi:Cytochrome C oxidase, cbb3-type, subunit III [Cnuella takakiae]|uniref:Cytochrome C oxidase, cbb3-type, subunit III n=1 Tax=Cnuella takakiae TaxID=1302690 RepID=A0A1M5EIR3_9BACT|nr:c-type cytochrome [Cnuella takakiae]OLY91191.1 hypothetical protein BUE76_04215 [Cnuella takakiae]SHF79129.1 Cytochrome C oxidase, cbb3-type, subunit III [Cnuella takakiae]